MKRGASGRNGTGPRGDGVEQAVGWVRQYRLEVEHWRQSVEVETVTEQFVKAHSLAAGGAQQLQARLAGAGKLPRTQQLRAEFLPFCEEEGAKAKAGERLVGENEVIESIFGKWKRLEGDQARSGLTGLVLALGAIVAPTTPEIIKQALTPSRQNGAYVVSGKTRENRASHTSRALCPAAQQAEQKQDQLQLAA